jgi:hypothetical protein
MIIPNAAGLYTLAVTKYLVAESRVAFMHVLGVEIKLKLTVTLKV